MFMSGVVKLVAASCILGTIFQAIGLPIAYMLAAMLLTFICNFKQFDFAWKVKWRNLALLPLGYSLGRQVDAATLAEITQQILSMGLSTVSIVGASILIAAWTSYKTKINLASSMIGNMPGGITQMLLLSEEMPNVDSNVVTVMQTTRLIASVVVVPFLVMHGLGSTDNASVSSGMGAFTGGFSANLSMLYYMALAGAVAFGTYLAVKIGIPTPYMLGPIIVTAFISSNMPEMPIIPTVILRFAQIFVGINMGNNLQLDKLLGLKKHLGVILFGTTITLVSGLLIGWCLSSVYGHSATTAFLATAPGGVTEMSITGMAIGANVSVILSYQLFRLLFMTAIMPYVIRWFFRHYPEYV